MKKREEREFARKMRQEGKTLTEICEFLRKPKSTVHSWIRHIAYTPSERTSKQKQSQIKATIAMQEKYKKLREEAYQEFWDNKEELLKDKYLRDFINIYLTEGYRKGLNSVCVANSNPQMIKISYYFIKKYSKKKLYFTIQYHEDQDLNELLKFWSSELNIDEESIRVARKSNSGRLEGRVWNSKYGVFTVGANDTYLRAKIQALMDVVESEWESNFSFSDISVIKEQEEPEKFCKISTQNKKVKNRPSRTELIELILTKPFTQIGNHFDVSDNAIRKWCKAENLPYRKADIEAQREQLEIEIEKALI